eukprot:Nitzschia sp. Nitz4//scaffold12_size214221//148404//149952//NITZ4_001516-RA/size214221-augustus-gene-0.9-mRNA-1//1//CDS//3329535068//7051//frame0
MAYRLKQVKFNSQPCYILLQNENGPCPLLAAANCLLLKGSISLPSNCVGAGVITIDQLNNILVEKILSNNTGSSEEGHHVQEVLSIFPSLQFGMDVNPKFTAGPTGMEYTMQLNTFDLLRIEMVHGWLLDPTDPEYDLIHNLTYNHLINLVIEGNDASSTLASKSDVSESDPLVETAHKGSIVQHFLDRSASQLTQYGLDVLHEYLKDGDTVVFFRNNHFNTMTKNDGLLYLLVTDFGYANVPSVVWERLDVIDGDTEYVADTFKALEGPERSMGAAAATAEQLVANNIQSEADYQLALQLSRETSSGASNLQDSTDTTPFSDPEMEAARLASLQGYQSTGSKPTAKSSQQGTVVSIPAETSTTTTTAQKTPAAPTTDPAPQASQPVQPSTDGQSGTVCMGVPVAPPSADEQLALKLHQQEMMTAQASGDQESLLLAKQLDREEREAQRRRMQGARRPNPVRTAAGNPSTQAKKDNCVIS